MGEYQSEVHEETFLIYEGGWSCEIALWASNATSHGLFRGGCAGCELLMLDTFKFQHVICHCRKGIQSSTFLFDYARFFLRAFNEEQERPVKTTPLFNDLELAAAVVKAAEPIIPRLRLQALATRSLSNLTSLSAGKKGFDIAGWTKSRAKTVVPVADDDTGLSQPRTSQK